MCGTPVLLTRDADGRVRALANVCRHRGVRLADGSGRAKRLTCPFHAWTYDLDGRLSAVPSAAAFEGMCRAQGLVELPVAEGYGLIVGRLRPGPPVDMDDYLGPGLADELAMLGFADWEPYGEPHVHQVGANWKVTLDTFRENYHFKFLHRRTLAKYAYGDVLTFDPFGPHLRNCSALRSIDELRGRPEAQWGDVSPYFSYQYALFPNTSLTFDSRHIELWQILPVAAERVAGPAHGLPPARAERARSGPRWWTWPRGSARPWSTGRTSGWPAGPSRGSGAGCSTPWCSDGTSPRRSTCTGGSRPRSSEPAEITEDQWTCCCATPG